MCSPVKKRPSSRGGTIISSSFSSSISSKWSWGKHFVLPILAGLFHLHVFYHAAFTFLLDLPNISHWTPSSEVYLRSYILDRAVVIAYTFDLICCYIFKVIPFSRCNTAKDIASHHLPILLGLMPLYIPTWAEWRTMDPLVHNVLDYHKDGGVLRYTLIYSLIKANGWGFLSSLNEFIMCFQRSEMAAQGVEMFQDDDLGKMNYRFMTSRLVIGMELYFKLGIFCVFSCFGFVARCSMDRVWYDYLMEAHMILEKGGRNILGQAVYGSGVNGASFWNAIGTIICSPIFWRSLLFRVFLLSMYPLMGMRTIKKIKKFHSCYTNNTPSTCTIRNKDDIISSEKDL